MARGQSRWSVALDAARALRRRSPAGPWHDLALPTDLPVVLLADDVSGGAVARWTGWLDGRRIEVVSPAEPPPWDWANRDPRARRAGPVTQVSGTVRLLGPVGAVVDLLPVPALPGEADDRVGLFRLLVGYVAADGCYVVDRETTGDEEGVRAVEQLVTGLLALPRDDRSALSPPDRELARAVRPPRPTVRALFVPKRTPHVVKLRDVETDVVLPAREPGLRLRCLTELPAGDLVSSAVVRSHGRAPRELPGTMDHPRLHLRRYDGAVEFAGRTLMYAGSTVLPDSFRHPRAVRLEHPRLHGGLGQPARVPDRYRPRQGLEGAYYQLDSTYTGHFGHVMTEVVSRLWGWDLARELQPDLRVLMFRRRHRRFRPELELRLLGAFGVDEADVTWVDEPVRLTSVVSASPMWNNGPGPYVHPGIRDVWARLTAGLLDRAANTDTPPRIFVSRSGEYGARLCRNAMQVENLFARHGWVVVYPEHHDLADQVRLFHHATHVAGFGGSAMFNLMHARDLRQVIVLNSEAYTARNEHLFTALTGGTVDYFWSPAETPQPASGWSKSAFESAWSFDFATHGDRLEELLG
ncbi:glycosyltransferase family 61 protein [Nocardioides guangzhouensis]|uniref:Glycosyltransferase family 61 protein n=1 Tax=Nocardioides guangzhouensis TaxID=2497878 RepID=A0A4Q4Z2E6_9ACTN|nr:glycosyltransferase family 61 protein [Nocardioides guangzhouensis]RYP81355.1 glycosyltransferase family 61 protein [Nocardioides guangzhouensis]